MKITSVAIINNKVCPKYNNYSVLVFFHLPILSKNYCLSYTVCYKAKYPTGHGY